MIKPEKSFFSSNSIIITFCIKTLSYATLFYLFLQFFKKNIFPYANRLTALSAKYPLLLFIQKVEIINFTITANNRLSQLTIIDECTGLFELFMFFAGILSFPTSIKNKIVGIFFGTLAIFFLNIFRIVFMFYIISRFPDLFEFIHIYLWSVLFTILVVSIWGIWFEWIANKNEC